MTISGRARQGSIYAAGVLGRRPEVPTGWTALEAAARSRLSAKAFAYVTGGAGLELTMAADRAAFARRQLSPRVLRDVSSRDLSVELFGRRLPAPMLLAPIGALGLVHRDADLAVARAAAALGLPYIFSNQASVPMEECAAAMGDSPRWFQLYWSTSDDLVASLVGRAEAAGAEAIVVTLDTTMLGWRPRDLDLGSLPFATGEGIAQYTSDPVFAELVAARAPGTRIRPSVAELPAALSALIRIARRHPGRLLDNLRSPVPMAFVQTFLDVYSRPSLTWDDLHLLRTMTALPVVLKGILHPDDARRAVDEGIDGLVVSTHGGRQVDGARGSLDALPGVVDAVDGRIPVLMDSGVRSGADVVKALALGARAVCIGRPYVYGLGLGGRQGVSDVLENLLAELDLTMGLCGLTRVADISADALAPDPGGPGAARQ
ncbi:FMN-dependent dehydrogenase, includes L-lactate dehydrogenase and type II isopentenyl diphosphate isomerase [Nakamurella panacisegetis]|uniref:FMN-dependent dehydrogenase, includes L-lactate dehydrogenase and type II isopentenyl diphosphate isomerase n=1 Tax=Nakamurella panacisegetis TaxID=1090615 RepID=A0A1H0MUE9_9ACTN|nr:alpha-hydroxy-acid oxidizing protein [Nakamurella panacisegetis]SDO84001.1 FMN-dependent dehydrogenase, includes L-lactate dehydrogenase and type II isopentenyl diphosphate isomerase [Nakamurella panacisegetis]